MRRRIQDPTTETLRVYRALVRSARENEEDSAPRKQHLVPASYLRRWAENGQIRVTDLNSGSRTFTTSPEKAARETDYYRLEGDEIDPEIVPPLLFEKILSEAERWGARAIDELLERPPAEIDPALTARFLLYLAFQFTRGRAFRYEQRELTNEFFRLHFERMTDDGIRELLRRQGRDATDEAVQEARGFFDRLADGRIVVWPQDPSTTARSGQVAAHLAEHLVNREWVVYRTPRVLITSDEPVVLIGGPGLPRDERPGFATAGAIVFPLAPDAVLAMLRDDIPPDPYGTVLDHLEVTDLNLEIAANSTRWVFERPAKRMTTRLRVPPTSGPHNADKFATGESSELVRLSRSTRWRNAELVPDWPVSRWWRSSRAG